MDKFRSDRTPGLRAEGERSETCAPMDQVGKVRFHDRDARGDHDAEHQSVQSYQARCDNEYGRELVQLGLELCLRRTAFGADRGELPERNSKLLPAGRALGHVTLRRELVAALLVHYVQQRQAVDISADVFGKQRIGTVAR